MRLSKRDIESLRDLERHLQNDLRRVQEELQRRYMKRAKKSMRELLSGNDSPSITPSEKGEN